MIEGIIRKIVPGGQVVKSWPLKGGMVAEMVGVAVETGEGAVRKLVVRRPSSHDEFKTLQLIYALGLPSPEPYFWDESGCLVMEFVEGEMDFGLGDVANYVRQMAGALARVHGSDLSGLSQADLSFLRRREGVCGEAGRTRPYVGPDGKVGGLDIGRMEAKLAQGPPGPGNAARLIHGDFWAGNMLWRDGALAAVIDWEDAGLGDPLKDLGEARVELVWLFGAAAVETFTDYYRAKVDIDYTNLAYWDLCATLRMLRLTKGDWGWLVDFGKEFGRFDLRVDKIEREYITFVKPLLI